MAHPLIQPNSSDILCGKDKACVSHAGSRFFRQVIDQYREKYTNALTKYDKMMITKEIYDTLSQTSRFLRFNDKEKSWEEITPLAARDKVGHALRFANRVTRKKTNKKKVDSSFNAASTRSSTRKSSDLHRESSIANATLATLKHSASGVSVAPTTSAAPANANNGSAPLALPTTYAAVAASLGRFSSAPAPPQNDSDLQLWGALLKSHGANIWNSLQIPSPPVAPVRHGAFAVAAVPPLMSIPANNINNVVYNRNAALDQGAAPAATVTDPRFLLDRRSLLLSRNIFDYRFSLDDTTDDTRRTRFFQDNSQDRTF